MCQQPAWRAQLVRTRREGSKDNDYDDDNDDKNDNHDNDNNSNKIRWSEARVAPISLGLPYESTVATAPRGDPRPPSSVVEVVLVVMMMISRLIMVSTLTMCSTTHHIVQNPNVWNWNVLDIGNRDAHSALRNVDGEGVPCHLDWNVHASYFVHMFSVLLGREKKTCSVCREVVCLHVEPTIGWRHHATATASATSIVSGNERSRRDGKGAAVLGRWRKSYQRFLHVGLLLFSKMRLNQTKYLRCHKQ